MEQVVFSSFLGRRRPFIMYYTSAVAVSLSVLYMSEAGFLIDSLIGHFHRLRTPGQSESLKNLFERIVEDLLLAQIILFICFTIIDSSLWTLEAPKTSYLLEVFNESDQRNG